MYQKLILTNDGSHSIELVEQRVTYHSIHGAIQESTHIFIDAGLKSLGASHGQGISVFEVGFGTGLNALLTLREAGAQKVYYETIEQFPIDETIVKDINYCDRLQRRDLQPVFERMHRDEWSKEISISPGFTLLKWKMSMLNFQSSKSFDVIYFDAFDPVVQPELWTEEVFRKLYTQTSPGGRLVTYSSKGAVRRALEYAGYLVEKLPGPPGKREITRAVRP